MSLRLYYNNKFAISIAHNPVQHDRNKHIGVDKHFIKEKLDSGLINTPYVSTQGQLVDILTKGLNRSNFERIISKLKCRRLIYKLERECRDILRGFGFYFVEIF